MGQVCEACPPPCVVSDSALEESKALLDTEVTRHIDLADLIERERIRVPESLSRGIEALQTGLVEDLQALGWRYSTSYWRRLVTKCSTRLK